MAALHHAPGQFPDRHWTVRSRHDNVVQTVKFLVAGYGVRVNALLNGRQPKIVLAVLSVRPSACGLRNPLDDDHVSCASQQPENPE